MRGFWVELKRFEHPEADYHIHLCAHKYRHRVRMIYCSNSGEMQLDFVYQIKNYDRELHVALRDLMTLDEVLAATTQYTR